jgi:hypothetical protein
MEPGSLDSQAWVVDSGCTSHMVGSAVGLAAVQQTSGKVMVGDKRVLDVVGVGQLTAFARDEAGAWSRVTLHNVMIVPGLGPNLLSVKRIVEAGGVVNFSSKGGVIVGKGGRLPLRQHGNLYLMDLRGGHAEEDREQQMACVVASAARTPEPDWHQAARRVGGWCAQGPQGGGSV